MKTTTSFLFLLTLAVGCVLAAEPDPVALMRGKEKTDRTIVLEATVNAPPAEVFRLWTSAEGVTKFFAPAARIDPTVGGRYEILFAPKQDPKGLRHGTKGARVLKAVPGKELAFEWITFAGDELLGKNAPPYAAPETRNANPLQTWVEISFQAVAGQPNQTHLKFAHYGFGEGELWAQSYQWFAHAWKGVLDQLVAYCEKERRAERRNTHDQHSLKDIHVSAPWRNFRRQDVA